MTGKEITVLCDPVKDDSFEIATTDSVIGHVMKHDLNRMTGQTEEGPIRARLCPCAYCGKKDKIRVEARCIYVAYQPTEFYRIRCKRLMCRFKDLFDIHFDESCDLDGLTKEWNGRYEAKKRGKKWREIE